jgi:hypothetical protein
MKHVINQLQVEGQAEFNSIVTGFRSQSTTLGTLDLVASDARKQIFTGTVVGQIVRLPDATTLTLGRDFEIVNASSAAIVVQDSAGTNLAYVSQARRCTLTCIANGTAAGSWDVDNVVSGANFQKSSAVGPVTNNSTATFVPLMTMVTPDLPLGDYRLDWFYNTAVANNARSGTVQVLDGVSVMSSSEDYVATSVLIPGIGGFARLDGISGIHTLILQFRVGVSGNTTITMTNARMCLRRMA